jgi:hypothetical protein
MLDQLRRLFENSLEIRHRIDAATYITNSALKAIEGKLSALGDDVREDLETVKARTVSLAIVEDIHRDVKESKEKTYLLGKRILTHSYQHFQAPWSMHMYIQIHVSKYVMW